jgi:hypothetical protein
VTDVGLSLSGSGSIQGIADNYYIDAANAVCHLSSCSPLSNYVGFQNSEPGAYSGFNDNVNDTYLFNLEVFNLQGQSLGSDSITVIAGRGASVPEPLTLSLFGAGLVGAAAMRRKARKA